MKFRILYQKPYVQVVSEIMKYLEELGQKDDDFTLIKLLIEDYYDCLPLR